MTMRNSTSLYTIENDRTAYKIEEYFAMTLTDIRVSASRIVHLTQ